MSKCIICLEECPDSMPCCKVPIHVACLSTSMEKGINTCPHCRHEIFQQQFIPVQVPIEIQQPDERGNIACNVFTGVFMFYALSTMFTYIMYT